MFATESTEVIADVGQNGPRKKRSWRNIVGFWILGLCNNYAYVIMLSAAFDLLKDEKQPCGHNKETNSTSSGGRCNAVSTGAILLADILPSLGIKLVAPFLIIGFNCRVLIVVALSALSFIITSTSVAHWMTFLGVICAALSSGLGEVTFLSFSSYFHKDVVSSWSSGTGGAGVFGALSYASLASWLCISRALQVMLLVPVIMAVTFWLLIKHPASTKLNCSSCFGEPNSLDEANKYRKKHKVYSLKQKIDLVKPLLKYMIPLGLVYFAEYFINQGLMELLFFRNAESWLDHDNQYRWYQVDYQVGVFLSRSSVNFFQIKKLWILPVLQFINLTVLLIQVCYDYLNSIWVVLAIILYEGLLGGCAYVNTFYKISQEVSEEDKEFSMGVASLGDAAGIALAGAVALPVHDALCLLRRS